MDMLTNTTVEKNNYLRDNKIKNRTLLFPCAIAYGFLIGLVIALYPAVAPLWIGVIIGVAAANKVDTLSHFVGVAVATGTAFAIGIPKINYLLGILFAFASFMDEKVDTHLHKIKKMNWLKRFLEARIIIEVTAFTVSIVTGVWVIFIAILFFDMGFIATEYIFRNKSKFW